MPNLDDRMHGDDQDIYLDSCAIGDSLVRVNAAGKLTAVEEL